MLRKPAVFFLTSFIFGFALTSLATPAVARHTLSLTQAQTLGITFPDALIASSPAATLISTPTLQPSSSPEATTQPKADPVVQAAVTPDAKTYIMNEINNFRQSKGLSAVRANNETCNFAKTRAGEIANNFNHTGFRDRINNKTLPYPSYSQVTENIAETYDFKRVVDLWINSSGHRENMEKDTPFVCVESNGNYYAYEGWKP